MLSVRLAGRDLQVRTAAGVFSGQRVDPGTSVLLEFAPPPPASGNLLDLGCGWGAIGLSLALRSPGAKVWAVDVNQRALALTTANAESAGVTNLTACEPEQALGLEFAAIWSNPPIRIGKPALHDLLLTWLPRLQRGGSAFLVVQKNLGSDSLQRWLSDQLPQQQVTRFASARTFRVLQVQA